MATQFRLPPEIKPTHYELSIEPDFETLKYEGDVAIFIQIAPRAELTSEIVLNAHTDIEVTGASFCHAGESASCAIPVSRQENQRLALTLPSPIAADTAAEVQIRLHFTGILNDKNVGFYRFRYGEGRSKCGGCTQFEPCEARRGFPCFDQPEFKTTFDVTMIVPEHMTALCNTPAENTEPAADKPGKTRVKFARSPPMSAYVLAFAVGEWDVLTEKCSKGSGTEVRCYVPRGKQEQGRFALQEAVQAIPWFEEFFGIEFPIPVMSLLAVEDFDAGAMENYGLIIFREVALLVGPSTSTMRRQRVAEVVVHEIAHQWYGNLVTPKWWSDLWLNEGHATVFPYLVLNEFHPDWCFWEKFASDEYKQALSLDALENSHPICVEVTDPASVNEIFDSISYSKAACVIYMVSQWLGPQFQTACQAFLRAHQYGNATVEDFGRVFDEHTGLDVSGMVASWTTQTGFPLLMVKETEQLGKFTVEQARFKKSGLEHGPTWSVPLDILVGDTADPTTPPHVLKYFIPKDHTGPYEIHIPYLTQGNSSTRWAKFNTEIHSFAHVEHPAEMLSRLAKAIELGQLPVLDRLSVLNDTAALARIGRVEPFALLELMKAFQKETSEQVWILILSCMNEYFHLFHNHEEITALLSQYGRALLREIVAKLGWEPLPGEAPSQSTLRPMVLSAMARRCEHPETLQQAIQRAQKVQREGTGAVPADLRGLALGVGAREIEGYYEHLMELYRTCDDAELGVQLLVALGSCTPRMSDTLHFALSDSVRVADAIYVLIGVTRNKHAGRLPWDFLKAQWSVFFERYASSGFMIPRIIEEATDSFTQLPEAQEVEAFFGAIQERFPGMRTVQQCLERIRTNAARVTRDEAKVKEALVRLTAAC